MSYAHYFVKNFKVKEAFDLFCYSTQFPHTLTSTQKITRLYRCVIRRNKSLTFNENRGDIEEFYDNVRIARKKFERLMEISQNTGQFKQTLEYYEQWMKDTMDPTILFRECRPYSATSGKYYIYDNEELATDYVGYYSGRPIGERVPELGGLYYPNFPMDANVWFIEPPGQTQQQESQDFKQ